VDNKAVGGLRGNRIRKSDWVDGAGCRESSVDLSHGESSNAVDLVGATVGDCRCKLAVSCTAKPRDSDSRPSKINLKIVLKTYHDSLGPAQQVTQVVPEMCIYIRGKATNTMRISVFSSVASQQRTTSWPRASAAPKHQKTWKVQELVL